MRLFQYINEEKSFSEWAPIIKKDCSKFTKEIKGAKGTLTRIDSYLGGNDLKNPVIKKNTRSKRRIMDTPEELSIEIDKLFKEKFGWEARSENVVFCWGTPFTSNDISYGFLVFPAGNYNYLWSPMIRDLYNSLPSRSFDSFKNRLFDSYTDKGLKRAVVSENEIMVQCKHYYIIRPELIEVVDRTFNLNWQGARFRGRKI